MTRYQANEYKCANCATSYAVGMCAVKDGWCALNPDCPCCGTNRAEFIGAIPPDDLDDEVLSELFDLRAEIRGTNGG